MVSDNKNAPVAKESKRVRAKKTELSPLVKELISFGLSENEARIYVYLLERGVATGGTKIAAGTNIHRQYVYLILPKLIGLGLAEEVSFGKRAKYMALSPSALEKIARQRVYKTESLIRDLTKVSKLGYEQESEVIVGEQGIVRHELDFLKEAPVGAHQYILGGNAQAFINAMGDAYEDMLKLDREKDIQTMYIGSLLDKNAQKGHVNRRGSFQTRYLDKMPEGITEIVVRDDRVVFYSFLNPPTLHIIKSPVVASNFKLFFMMLWDMAGEKKEV